jgi:putative tryptophan/tyrosine transport system substrate-binding protein
MFLKNRFCSALLGFGLTLTVLSNPGLGQQSVKPVRIGIFMSGFPAEYASHDRGLIAGLRERGYIEGKNLTVVRRYGQLDMQRIFGFAQELATMELDTIVTVCTATTRAAVSATSKTPIVMLSVSDPVGHGLAASLARPGMNVTGRSNLSRTLVPKLLQVFRDAVPTADRIAVLVNSHNPLHEPLWAEALIASQPLNVSLVRIDGHLPADFDVTMERVLNLMANALFVMPDDPPSLHLRPQLAAFAKKHRLPLVIPYGDVFEDDALLRYGEDLDATARLSATHIDKIAHGANAGDLPIEQPTRFVLAVNLKVARYLGITIPPSVLLRADNVIE